MERNGYSLASLESCTGGLIASLLTDVEGAGYLVGAGVAYSPAAKAAFGVSPRVIERYGLVSREVALALAERAARWFETDVGWASRAWRVPGQKMVCRRGRRSPRCGAWRAAVSFSCLKSEAVVRA